MGVMILFVIGLIMNIRALHNENYMKKQYIKDNDERSIQIHAKGKSTGATNFMCIILTLALAPRLMVPDPADDRQIPECRIYRVLGEMMRSLTARQKPLT